MKLCECKHGILVQLNEHYTHIHGSEKSLKIGMIVGITNNIGVSLKNEFSHLCDEPSRAIPLVQWQSGEISPIHYSNIDIFEEF